MKTVAFKTLGCKVNQYETQAIREQFLNAGFKEASRGSPADIYLINTCTVTSKTDAESRRLIRNAVRENPGSKVVVTGCYTELDSEEINKIANGLLVIKNSEKPKILQYLKKAGLGNPAYPLQDRRDIPVPYILASSMSAISRFEGRTKAFVKIQDGCDNFCSYCKVPYARGRSKSRPIEEILLEIRQLVSNGYREIILTGVCLGDWGRNLNLDLTNLLDEIENNVDGHFRIRLSSIEPWYVTPHLIENLAGSKRLCKHLHIPMQSGDDGILGRMNRKFNSADFVDLINKVRLHIPEIAFTTDIVVGFPAETEDNFANTLKIMKLTRPSRVHIFPFSPRKGTAAYNFQEQVPNAVVKDRINRLKAISDNLALEYRSQFAGSDAEILVETKRDSRTGLLVGYTDTYIKVAFEGPNEAKGTLYRTRLPDLTNQNSYDILAAHLEGETTH